MSVPQFPSSVTPVCSLPSHLWTVSDSLWGVRLGRSVCPAELWVRKVRAPHVTEQNSNESKLRKRTEKMFLCTVRDESVWLIFFLFLCKSLPNWCFHWTLLYWLSGDFRVVLYEKSCILPSLCGVTGEKYTMGLNFTFTNECCNTHLCNRAATPTTSYWTATLLTLLISYSVWWIKQWRELFWYTWSKLLFLPSNGLAL